MHKQNSSCDSQAKLIFRSVLKWCKFHRNKKLQKLWFATQDSCNALNWSRTGKKLGFLFIHLHFWTDLNGCQQRLLYAQQLTQRKCGLCLQGNSVNTFERRKCPSCNKINNQCYKSDFKVQLYYVPLVSLFLSNLS